MSSVWMDEPKKLVDRRRWEILVSILVHGELVIDWPIQKKMIIGQ